MAISLSSISIAYLLIENALMAISQVIGDNFSANLHPLL